MAAKRLFDDSDRDAEEASDKRMRPNRPSLASIIGEAVRVKNMQNLLSGLEPLLRKVVNEEVERVIIRHRHGSNYTRSPSLRIEAASSSSSEQPPKLQLMFTNELSLPIFTSSRILDAQGNPMQVILVDKTNNDQMVRTSLPYPIKLELVVLDGDFPGEESWWSSEQFNRHIVKERTGKRPLLSGELNLTMRDGIAPMNGEIEFTDNSSWIRSRKFRVAVRVAPNQQGAIRIREGITQAFIVKDHRGELYKKHHPPMLEDQVWRLEKIGKDGAFHKKLSAEGINTVQEFLKLSVVDPQMLRKILGIGMSEKMWEATIKHAKTCKMGNKVYMYSHANYTIYLSPICQLIRADINGQILQGRDLNTYNRGYLEKMVSEAYSRWNELEEIDQAVLNDNVALLTQGGEQFANNHEAAAATLEYDESKYFGYVPSSSHSHNNELPDWELNAMAYGFSKTGASTSDSEWPN
ncbi:protein SAR DEFICIENT 1 [Arachis duranensis]|uniref:Protein SAR DEFICIENT 1 n=1 Tax=Arachis duranensis TaxID=130453 RepID=A0A6P4CN03_ARADU|nr:protein SAR DEFICIENT 1 [Arachis duranensis]XP_057747927.1 protein SAR DEFICIENT 1-like [Arachis stenosperma]